MLSESDKEKLAKRILYNTYLDEGHVGYPDQQLAGLYEVKDGYTLKPLILWI